MESILNLIANAENVRMLVILAFVSCGYVLLNSRMSRLEYSLNKQIYDLRGDMNSRINELRGEMKELKYNDFAHLSSAFEALTYVLEKNSLLSKEDKEFVDSRLAH
ncbi:MAG: hypothetical protein LBC64_04090 [Fibromonadaceae bacterium]|jgi:hypothetical protein|nr:hypothetical protein [Fibromonadaceae bacterium]